MSEVNCGCASACSVCGGALPDLKAWQERLLEAEDRVAHLEAITDRTTRFRDAHGQVLTDHAKTFQLLADRPTEPAPISAGEEKIACAECLGSGFKHDCADTAQCDWCNGTGLEPGL